MLLLIDNYDSFTFNLVHLFEKLGVSPYVLRNDNSEILKILHHGKIDALIISPGPKCPLSTGLCLSVLEKIDINTPILGVCLGHQVLGYFAGYKIVQAKQIMHGKTSKIYHNNKGIFKDVENCFTAIRYHSLVIGPKRIESPIPIEITAKSDDNEIMGIEFKDRPWFGIQFHPESILTPCGELIIKNFLEIAC